jgi:acyl-coenzyme A thioesterase PaaI-like protein
VTEPERPLADPSRVAEAFSRREAGYTDLDRARLRLAEATRRIQAEQMTSVADAAAVERAMALVAEAADLLARREHGRPYEGVAEGSLEDPQHRAFVDYGPLAGPMNPIAPPLRLEWSTATVIGRATFGDAYEGPPGCLHGGFIAAAFDDVLGFAQSLSGNPGMTGRLTVSYRAPTPLHTELVFTGRYLRTEGRKVFASATLHAGDTLCADAEGLFIAMRPDAFARMVELRGRPVNLPD